MGKNKKKKESDALLAFAIQYKSGTLPPRKIKDLSEMMEEEQQPQEKRIGGALVIDIEDDLDVRDANLAQLRRPFGSRTVTTDLDRYFEWQLRWELSRENAQLDAIKREEVIHVRNHRDLGLAIDTLVDLSGRADG